MRKEKWKSGALKDGIFPVNRTGRGAPGAETDSRIDGVRTRAVVTNRPTTRRSGHTRRRGMMMAEAARVRWSTHYQSADWTIQCRTEEKSAISPKTSVDGTEILFDGGSDIECMEFAKPNIDRLGMIPKSYKCA